MSGRMHLSFYKWLIASTVLITGLTAPVVWAQDTSLAAGAVRFALDTGEPANVVGLAATLEGESADYLRARLLRAVGEKNKARARFEAVYAGSSHRGDAALALAEMLQRQGDLPGAEQWYQRASQAGYGEVVQKALLGLAEMARNQGRADAAGRYLAQMKDGYWAAVGYMNLAADLARQDLDSSRALVSLRVAMAMAAKDPDSDRSRAILDQLNLRAGYLALVTGDLEKALDFLEKVALQSYHTPRALYLHGLALSRKGNHRAAMQSWHRAKKFPLAFPGVSDAWIGMGRGYDLSGYPGQAGESWLAANAAYESERVTLGKLADRIRQDGAYKALIQDARSDDIQWFLADSRTLTQPRMAYLMRFMEQPAAQSAVHRVAQLDQMTATLDQNRANLEIFIQALDDVLHPAGKPTRTSDTGRLEKRQADLQARLDQLDAYPATRTQVSELNHLKQVLASADRRLSVLTQQLNDRPERFRAFRDDARALLESTEDLRRQALRLRVRAARELDALALEFVQKQTQRMTHALDKTEQQIAHLYEYLALENLGEGPP